MNTVITIDKAGRVVIPKPLRDELGLMPGDSLELKAEGGNMTLSRVQTHGRLYKRNGFWVFRGEGQSNIDVVKMIEEMREERDRHVRGEE